MIWMLTIKNSITNSFRSNITDNLMKALSTHPAFGGLCVPQRSLKLWWQSRLSPKCRMQKHQTDYSDQSTYWWASISHGREHISEGGSDQAFNFNPEQWHGPLPFHNGSRRRTGPWEYNPLLQQLPLGILHVTVLLRWCRLSDGNRI